MLGWTLLTVVLSGALIEAFVEPRIGLTLSTRRLAISGCFAALLMMTLLLLSARPVFSAATAILLMVITAVASNAKFGVLREPLVAIDLAMLAEVTKHPRLFLPHVPAVPAVLLVATIILGIVAAIEIETPVRILPGEWMLTRLAEVVGIGIAVVALFWLLKNLLVNWAWRLGLSLDPRIDLSRFGLFGTLLINALLLTDQTGKDAVRRQRRRTLIGSSSARLPDIVVVQAESFFDVRHMDRRIAGGLLCSFDACGSSAVFRGRLWVPAWGAATQRTEFAFLTGLPEDALGLDRHNPYLRLAKKPVWSIAHDLRELGYRTICLHPFFGSFFKRHRVMPNLGFDEFLDIAAFDGAERFGPYVSDLAIAEKIIDLLQKTGQPRFIFAITMENHGQWQKDRLPPEVIAQAQSLAPGFPAEFLCYLRHLGNADAMVGRVAGAMRHRGDGVLCMFGDHLPSFPKLFERANFADPRSDYFIWRPGHAEAAITRDVNVQDLADLLLSATGIEAQPALLPSAAMSPSTLPDCQVAAPPRNVKTA
jgi:hypothetical protein